MFWWDICSLRSLTVLEKLELERASRKCNVPWPNTNPNIFYYPHHTADLSIAFQMNEASIISQFEWRSLIVGISRPRQPTITLMWANKCTYLIESLHLCLISAPLATPSWECTARWMWGSQVTAWCCCWCWLGQFVMSQIFVTLHLL